MKLHLFTSFLAASLLASVTAFGAEFRDYSDAAFEEAQRQGKTVLLQFHKDGCTTCAAQQDALAPILSERDPTKFQAFVVKYDPSSKIAKQYGVTKQSTLVVVRKAAGITDEQEIRRLVQ